LNFLTFTTLFHARSQTIPIPLVLDTPIRPPSRSKTVIVAFFFYRFPLPLRPAPPSNEPRASVQSLRKTWYLNFIQPLTTQLLRRLTTFPFLNRGEEFLLILAPESPKCLPPDPHLGPNFPPDFPLRDLVYFLTPFFWDTPVGPLLSPDPSGDESGYLCLGIQPDIAYDPLKHLYRFPYSLESHGSTTVLPPSPSLPVFQPPGI